VTFFIIVLWAFPFVHCEALPEPGNDSGSKGRRGKTADSNRFPLLITSALFNRRRYGPAPTPHPSMLSKILLCGGYPLLERHKTLAEEC
jgi:hypothetical protein